MRPTRFPSNVIPQVTGASSPGQFRRPANSQGHHGSVRYASTTPGRRHTTYSLLLKSITREKSPGIYTYGPIFQTRQSSIRLLGGELLLCQNVCVLQFCRLQAELTPNVAEETGEGWQL